MLSPQFTPTSGLTRVASGSVYYHGRFGYGSPGGELGGAFSFGKEQGAQGSTAALTWVGTVGAVESGTKTAWGIIIGW